MSNVRKMELRHAVTLMVSRSEDRAKAGMGFESLKRAVQFITRYNERSIENTIRDMLYDGSIVPDCKWNLRLSRNKQ